MDKVNMSVAILPMAHEFGWGPAVSGLVQSSFFWGYLLFQLPGGFLSSRFGGRNILPWGLGIQSFATAAVPLLAGTVPGLCLSRAAVGVGEAIAPSAAIDILSRIMPPTERSRAVSFVFSGLHVGSVLGLLLGPIVISRYGWQPLFLLFGALGLIWVAWFGTLMERIALEDPQVALQMQPPVPWRAMLRNPPLQALMAVHFCNQWFHYTMMAWLPTYFVDTLSVDLMHASQTALLPPLAAIAASAVAGSLADTLISKGLAVGTVRKLAQGLAFLGPCTCLLAACYSEDSNVTVAAITAALGVSSFSLAGLYCTHGDMSPQYASIMLSITKTPGAIPGIIGVPTVGFLFEQTQSWELSLFAPSMILMVVGAIIYTLGCRNEPVDFDSLDNSPFLLEKAWARLDKDE
ncbi:MAG: hypothetical protein WDW36_008077 [Sanguina aurantia]